MASGITDHVLGETMETASRLNLEADVSQHLEQLKDRVDWLVDTVELQELQYKELVKLETRIPKLNRELDSIFERLGIARNF